MQTRKFLKLAPLALLLAVGLAHAVTDLETAQKLWLAGQRPQAVATIEKALKATPDELKLRFALGVMRMEMGERDAALSIFISLTQDFPDLSDPYNNLAVLHAAMGQLDQAHSELEQALRLQPDNAQAQENLGDLLLRLAERAYKQAQGAQIAPSEALALKLKRTQALVQESAPR